MRDQTSTFFIILAAILLTSALVLQPGPEYHAPLRATDKLIDQIKQETRGEVKQPSDWFALQRILPENRFNMRFVERAKEQAERLDNEHGELDETWTFAGPDNIGGRITALAVNPENTGVIYAGAALGGVMKSVDGGITFQPVFAGEYEMSVGAMAMDPADTSTIWLGTGEANSSGDSYPGNGVYRTTDAGESWDWMGLEDVARIGRIMVDPTNSNRVFVAAMGILFGTNPERGVYRTLDGGESWTQVLFVNDSTGCTDLAIDPQHPDTIYAAMWQRVRYPDRRDVGGLSSGVWRSHDGGDSWERLTDGLPVAENVGRIGIAVAPSNPSRVYAYICDNPGYMIDLYRSDNGGDSWSAMNVPGGVKSELSNSFGWYFGRVAVNPADEGTVYLLGVEMYKGTEGGQNWTQVFSDAHVDHHAIWINPESPSHIVAGHDGGVNVSFNSGATSQRFQELPVSQFYAIAHDHTVPHRLYGGTQDNSTMRTMDGSVDNWQIILGGDGFYCAVNPDNNQKILGCMQWGYLFYSTNGGTYFNGIYGDFVSDRTNWMTPYQLDPANPDLVYLGTNRVWRCNLNSPYNWTPISGDLTNGPGDYNLSYGTITTIAVSPVDDSVIYVGTDDGNVQVTEDSGESWVNISDDLPDLWVTRVAPHPDSASVVYVSFSGYREPDPTPQLWRSDDFGANWINVGGELPPGPINDVIVDPENTDYLYVGSDFGVYYTPNLGAEWFPLGEGLPPSAVFDLELIEETRTLAAGTHGRSIWTYPLTELPGYPPSTFSLLQPPDSTRFLLSEPWEQLFAWSASNDPDPADTVFYSAYFSYTWEGADSVIAFGGLADTTLTITLPDVLLGETELVDTLAVLWYVRAISGGDSVESAQRRVFILDPDNSAGREQLSFIPESFAIASAYPNPFNSEINVEVDLPRAGRLEFRLFNVLGGEVARRDCGYLDPGRHKVVFRPKAATGVYYLQAVSGNNFRDVRKIMLVR